MAPAHLTKKETVALTKVIEHLTIKVSELEEKGSLMET